MSAAVEERLRRALAGRYRLDRVVGEGGMATVYLAHDVRHDRPVAIKVLKPDLAVALGPERFLREIRITARLSHPHILPLLDSGEADGLLYFVSPYVAGESLRALLQREGPLPIERAVQITAEVGDALAFAHEQGVVHRDVKPGNVLLSSDHALVADFGIAKAVSAAGGERLTRTALAIGTPAYMSPEQMTGELEVDHRSDIYALGCLLFEMLAGEPPHYAKTAPAMLAKRLSTPAPSLTSVRPDMPGAVDAAVARALAAQPADRFASAQDFVRALRGEASTATPRSGRSRTPRRRTIRLAGAGVVAVLAAWLVIALRPGESLAYSDGDWLLVTDFDNATGEQVLDKSLDVAFNLALQQSSILKLFPPARIQRALQRMVLDPESPITESVGREIAEREGVRYVLSPSVAGLGGRYALGLTVHEVGLDEPVHTTVVRVNDSAELLSGLDQLSDEVRTVLGEDRGAIRADAPLADVTTPSLPALRQFSLGVEAMGRSDLELARGHFRSALAIDSTFAAAHAQLGALELDFFDPEQGAEHLERALANPSRLTEYEALMMRGLFADGVEGDLAEAEATYRRVADIYPNRPAPRNNLGWIRWRQGRYEEAVAEYRAALAIDPAFNWAYWSLNRLQLFQLGMIDSAYVAARRQLEQDDAYGWTWSHLGWALMGMDSLDAARAAFERAVALEPRELEHTRGLAHAARLSGRTDEAIAALETAIDIDSLSVNSLLELALLRRAKGDSARAVIHLRTAARALARRQGTGSEDSGALALLSLVLAELGEPGPSREAARRAEELAPPSTDVLFNLARSSMARGEHTAALEHLLAAVDAGFADVLWMGADPFLLPLHGDPGFEALAAGMRR